MSKTLVAYFSVTGTTERAAKSLAAATGADLYEIAPAKPYTRADLNWHDSSSRTTKERDDESARPALAGDVPSTAGYDAIFVGFPVWWYAEPRIVDTFLDACDLAGKTVVPFATSGGSSVTRAAAHIRGLHPEARVLDGRTLNGSPSKGSLATWVDGLGI